MFQWYTLPSSTSHFKSKGGLYHGPAKLHVIEPMKTFWWSIFHSKLSAEHIPEEKWNLRTFWMIWRIPVPTEHHSHFGQIVVHKWMRTPQTKFIIDGSSAQLHPWFLCTFPAFVMKIYILPLNIILESKGSSIVHYVENTLDEESLSSHPSAWIILTFIQTITADSRLVPKQNRKVLGKNPKAFKTILWISWFALLDASGYFQENGLF